MANKLDEAEHLMDDFADNEVNSEPITSIHHASHSHRTHARKLVITLILLLSLSVLLNTVFMPLYFFNRCTSPQSDFAGLAWISTQKWTASSEYYSRHHATNTDQAWSNLDFNTGIVALSDEEVASFGLPTAQRFPWDDSRGVYLINAYHSLHCLQWLWNSLAKFRDGGSFDSTDWHGFYCLDQLRQDTFCSADDTPRYSDGGHKNHSTGYLQPHKCRDWSKLEQWAKERTACYRFLTNKVEDASDRFKFCPQGSPYNDVITAKFGQDERQRLIDVYGDLAS